MPNEALLFYETSCLKQIIFHFMSLRGKNSETIRNFFKIISQPQSCIFV